MTARPGEDAPRADNRVIELDALRGLAALCFVLYHFTWFIDTVLPGARLPAFQLRWGCYGVQLFFAISGFVILMTLDRTVTVRQFARARFRRLFPAYWIAMAATFAIADRRPDRHILLLASGNLRWIAVPPLVKLGAISYPLYLVHAAIGYSIIVRLEALGVSATPATIAALAATLLLAGMIARITERPVRSRRGFAPPAARPAATAPSPA